jgi:hypothetical protein
MRAPQQAVYQLGFRQLFCFERYDPSAECTPLHTGTNAGLQRVQPGARGARDTVRNVVHSAFATAFAAGTRFTDEGKTIEMSTRVLGTLDVPSGRLVACDPFTTEFAPPSPGFARTAPTGVFPVEVAIARFENGDQRIACARVRFASPDERAVKWEPAFGEGQGPFEDGSLPGYGVDAGTGCFFDCAAVGDVGETDPDEWLVAFQANQVDTWSWHVTAPEKASVILFSSGFGDGIYTSYWGFDASGAIVELVTDFEVLIGATWERFEIPLPLPRGAFDHPLLKQYAVTLRVPFFSRNSAKVGGKAFAKVELTDGTPVEMVWKLSSRHYSWKNAAPGAKLIVSVMTGTKPLETA